MRAAQSGKAVRDEHDHSVSTEIRESFEHVRFDACIDCGRQSAPRRAIAKSWFVSTNGQWATPGHDRNCGTAGAAGAAGAAGWWQGARVTSPAG